MPPYTGRSSASVAGSPKPLLETEGPDAIIRRSSTPKAAMVELATHLTVATDQDELGSHQPLDSLPPEATPPSLPDSDPWAAYYESVGHRSDSRSPSSEASSTSSSELNSVDAFYKEIGYLPPLDDSTLDLLEQVLADPSMALNGGRINPSEKEEFRIGLDYRNVHLMPFRDPYSGHIKSLSPRPLEEESNEKKRKARAWELDLQKSRDDSFEPVFQRTVMMSMINRHSFIYYSEDDDSSSPPILDFAVEDAWKCPPMPSRALNNAQPRCLSQPKPDLAIAFRQNAIFQYQLWSEIPRETQRLVCYEGQKQAPGKEARIFHFLTIEAKNKFKSPDDEVGFYQSLNNASQSLHSMYEFFREAGESHIRVFFEKVRFFSIVSTSDGIKIRIHRACPTVNAILTEEARPENSTTAPEKDPKGPVPRKRSIVADYPLQFVYEDFFEANSQTSDFTREEVVRVFETIIVGYGIGELRGYLRAAAQDFERKCIKHAEENNNKHLERDSKQFYWLLSHSLFAWCSA